MNKNTESKENFCPVCLAVPLAFASATAGVAGRNIDNNKNIKKMYYITGVISFILSILFFIYYYYKGGEDCTDCN